MSRVSSRAWSLSLSPWILGIAWSIVSIWVPGTIAAEPGQLPAQTPSQSPSPSPSPSPSQTESTEAAEAVPPTATSNTISLTELTRPSLWWAKEQFSDRQRFGSQLIAAWAAYDGQPNQLGRVDFFVNRQLWSQLDYLERYTFIHEFGTVANGYGYNVRVFNERKEFLAAYTCNSSPAAAAPAVPVCNTTLDSSGKSGFRSRSPNLLAP